MKHDGRRDAPRLAEQHDVLIKVMGADNTDRAIGGRIYTCATSDLSATGLCLSSSVPFPVNAQLDLRLRANTHQFALCGRVRWSSFDDGIHAVGIRFEPIDGDDTAAWEAWAVQRN
jgi:hypothetical protein